MSELLIKVLEAKGWVWRWSWEWMDGEGTEFRILVDPNGADLWSDEPGLRSGKWTTDNDRMVVDYGAPRYDEDIEDALELTDEFAAISLVRTSGPHPWMCMLHIDKPVSGVGVAYSAPEAICAAYISAKTDGHMVWVKEDGEIEVIE